MLQALLASVASIQAQQTRMNVIGNDLANINTTAFKGSDTTFEDMIAQTVRGATAPTDTTGGTNPVQYGLGVMVGGTVVNETQGSLDATDVSTDLAIQGNGYFMVSNGDGGIQYTRDGACDLDASGDLVNGATGLRLLGWMADSATGDIDTNEPITSASAITIPIGERTAVQETTGVTWAGNLDSESSATLPATAATFLDGTSVDSSYLTATVTVYDKLGAADDLTVGLTQVQLPAGAPTGATSCWVWNAAGSGDLGDSTGATASVSSGGTLYFNSDGDLIDTGTAQDVTITPASDGAPAYTVSMDFSSMTSLASQSQFEASSQNGFPPGSLESYSIGTNGVITGLFTNGLTRTLAQIACAVIPNPNGLESVGENMYQTTDNSGVPVVGTAQSGGLGAIDSGYLEQSNVDISTEFTNLIVTQRGFEANTKVVTTIDQMLQDLMGVIQ